MSYNPKLQIFIFRKEYSFVLPIFLKFALSLN